MQISYLFLLAAVSLSVQGTSVPSRPGTALRPRDVFSSSSINTLSTVVQTYQTLSTHFEETRTSLESQTDIQGAVATLSSFRQNLLSEVQQYSRGCECVATEEEGSTYGEMVSQWFLELQTMIQLVQQKWPGDYNQYVGNIFSEISSGLQTALAVAYDAGVDVQYLVSGLNLDQQLFSSVHVETSVFTSFTSTTTYGTASSGPALWRGGPLRVHNNPIRPKIIPLGRPSFESGTVPNISGPRIYRPHYVPNGVSPDHKYTPIWRDPRGASIKHVDPNTFATSLANKKHH